MKVKQTLSAIEQIKLKKQLLMASDDEHLLPKKDKFQKKTKRNLDLSTGSNISDMNNITEHNSYMNLPLNMAQLLEGIHEPLMDDYNVPVDKKPNWLDMKKFKTGQKFAQKYYFGLIFAEMLAVINLLSFPGGLQSLIFTGKSGTPFTAFQRYLSTVLRLNSWFDHDVWNKNTTGYRNLKVVRAMHINTSKLLNSTPYDQCKSQLTLSGSLNGADIWCPLHQSILKDFQSSCPFQMYPIENNGSDKVFLNQLEMSITQFGFIFLVIMYPDKFGVSSATEEEFEGFVHFWRTIGYLLGIKDKYNFCNGNLEEVRQRSYCLVNNWVRPCFRDITEDWEHMTRCAIEGISYCVPGLSFEVTLLYLCWVLDIKTPRLYASTSWTQYLLFSFVKVTMCFIIRIPGIMSLCNLIVHTLVQSKATMSLEQLKKLQSKTYDFERIKVNINKSI